MRVRLIPISVDELYQSVWHALAWSFVRLLARVQQRVFGFEWVLAKMRRKSIWGWLLKWLLFSSILLLRSREMMIVSDNHQKCAINCYTYMLLLKCWCYNFCRLNHSLANCFCFLFIFIQSYSFFYFFASSVWLFAHMNAE